MHEATVTEEWGRIENLKRDECMVLAFIIGADPERPGKKTLHARFPAFAIEFFQQATPDAKLELLHALDRGMETFKRCIVSGA